MSRLLVTVAAAVLAAALPLASATTLRWSSQGDYLAADPHAANEGLTNAINAQVFDGLVMRGRNGEIVPALATAWRRTAPDRWIFSLRRGVKFHDGGDFTADDVVFSFNRMRQATVWRFYAESLGQVSRVDDYTVEFATPGPNPVVLETLAENMLVMSHAWCRRHHVEAQQSFGNLTYAVDHAAGTGAFALVAREADTRSRFRKNPAWWGIAAGQFDGNVDEMVYVPLKSAATRVAALLSGEIDFLLDPSPADLETLRRTPSVRVYEGVENRVVYLSMDQSRDELLYSSVKGRNPFKDPRVRHAIHHAIDIEAIRRFVMRGQAQPAGVLLPNLAATGLPAELDRPRQNYDPAASRRLLREAGYEKGFRLTLDCPNDRLVNDERICVAIAGMLAKVGIETDVRAVSKSLFFPRIRKGDASFYIFSWGGATDPLFTLVPLMHSTNARGDGNINYGHYEDRRLDALIDAARVEMDERKRADLTIEALELHREAAYDIPLHRQMATWAARANVEAIYRPDNTLQASWVRMR